MKKTLRKKAAICFCAAEMAFQGVFTSYGAWQAHGGQWQYTPPDTRETVRSSWYQVDGQWYWFDQNGYMKTGWHMDPDGRWYFLNPISDGTKGRMMTGWQWIDGYCYYLSEKTAKTHPLGAMYAGEQTTDGYQVNKSGAWIKADGSPVYRPGKGIITKAGHGGSQGGISGSGSKSSGSSINQARSFVTESGGGKAEGNSQTMLSPVNVGVEKKGEESDNAVDRKEESGSEEDPDSRDDPSNKGRPGHGQINQVHWKIHFTDLTTHQSQLAPPKSGISEDGADLTIYFQTKIIDGDNRIWKSLQKSPYVIAVTGPQDRIIYVEYEEIGTTAQEADPWKEEKEHLKAWMDLAKKQESSFLGGTQEEFLDSRFFAQDKNSCDKRLKSAAARIEPGESGTFYVIGRNYVPEGSVLTKIYGDAMEYSNTVEGQVTVGQDVYVLSRFQLRREQTVSPKEHVWSPGEKEHWNIGDVQQRELDGKPYRFRCIDQNYGDETDRCRQKALFLCETVIPADTGSSYIYEKREDGAYGYEFYPGPVVSFGDSDSYKYSNIRTWLKHAEADFEDAQEIPTGVSFAYEGGTKEGGGKAAAISGQGLKASYIGSQTMTDRLFILSVDEAVKYASCLWTFDGAKEENPESQLDTFCQGYWLRNPSAGKEGDKVYVVDLIRKNIRSQNIKPGTDNGDEELDATSTVGVRPAFAVRQR